MLKVLSFLRDGEIRLGVRRGDRVVDVAAVDPRLPRSVKSLLAAGPEGIARLAATIDVAGPKATYAIDEIEWAPLIPDPGKIVCLGLNFHDHIVETGHANSAMPVVFLRSATSLVAHRQAMLLPPVSSQFDFEGEMAVVIARRGHSISRADAWSHVGGCSIFNDGSVRDYQNRTSQWTFGKNFDRSGAFGPELTTADELPVGATGLDLRTYVNDVLMQHANTSMMIFGVGEAIERISQCMTLEPGDIVMMGTPAGVGAARTPPIWLRPGDRCRVEIDRLGVLENVVAAASHPSESDRAQLYA